MSKKKILFKSAVGVSAIASGVTLAVGERIYHATFGIKPQLKADEMELYYSQSEGYILEKIQKYEQQKFLIENSRNGYLIETLHLKSPKESEDVIILVHGIRSNYHDLLPDAFHYLEEGYNVILYNQRQTGLTGGKDYSFGLYEKVDLDEVVIIARRLYPKGKLGIHGFSMGAATAAMHVELNEKSKQVDFYVLDAPYHTLESTIDLGLNWKKPVLLPKRYVKWSGDFVLGLKKRIHYRDIEPIRAIAHGTVPVLIIHGTIDKITDPKGSQLLYDAIPHENKKIILFEGDAHCTAHKNRTEEYFEKIHDFIKEMNLI